MDLLEPAEPLLEKAKRDFSDPAEMAKFPPGHKIGKYFLQGLQVRFSLVISFLFDLSIT